MDYHEGRAGLGGHGRGAGIGILDHDIGGHGGQGGYKGCYGRESAGFEGHLVSPDVEMLSVVLGVRPLQEGRAQQRPVAQSVGFPV
jgi:hypothetical protein